VAFMDGAGRGVEPPRPEGRRQSHYPVTTEKIRFQLVLSDLALATEHPDSRADQAVLGWEERKVLQVSVAQCRSGGIACR
jgi:hypothetical protein